jgi:hypothetical protein
MSDSPAAVYSAVIDFKNGMREVIEDIRQPGRVSPEVLAERFCENEISAAKRRWPSRITLSQFLAGARAQVRADVGLRATPDPLYERFLTRLGAELDKASEPYRG